MQTANPLADGGGMREYIQVQLPRGTTAGMQLNVRIPNGEVVSVVVPQGAEAGSYIRSPLDSAVPVMPASDGVGEGLMSGSGGGAAGGVRSAYRGMSAGSLGCVLRSRGWVS